MALSALAAFAVSVAATAGLIRWQDRLRIMDVPNERSSHDRPKPRTGGIALLAAVAAGVVLGPRSPGDAWLAAGAAYFFVLGLADDLLRLPEWQRFLAQCAFALAFACFGPRLMDLGLPAAWALPAWLAVLATAFWLVGFMNLFNFMDGTDGIAASEAVLVCAFMAGVFPSPWCLAVCGAAAGFLLFNHQPSKIFMGDSGSYLLGFLLAALSVKAGSEGGVPFAALAMFSGTFIADTTSTLLRRMARGEVWYKAHRSHCYQKLTDLGFSHAQVAWMNAGLTVLLGLLGLRYAGAGAGERWLLLAAFLLAVGIPVALIRRAS